MEINSLPANPLGFFESFPDPPAGPEWPQTPALPVWMKPIATMPASMAENAIIVRDERLAIPINGLSVCPNGFEFSIHIRFRSEGNLIDPFGHRRRRNYVHNSGGGEPDDPSRNPHVGILSRTDVAPPAPR